MNFVGAVPETSPYMAEAEVMLLTSRYEGYPAVMIEAMVAGTYVVARNASCPCGSGKKYKHCHGKHD